MRIRPINVKKLTDQVNCKYDSSLTSKAARKHAIDQINKQSVLYAVYLEVHSAKVELSKVAKKRYNISIETKLNLVPATISKTEDTFI